MAIIRHIRIENFRGINLLVWHVHGRVVCLVGPGDSCKTTILDAIECALSPRWNLAFSDTDFYQGNLKNSIIIELTIGELPDELVTEDKYGLYLRGYDLIKGIQDDPDDASEQVLTIQLQIDQTLEPHWTLVKASNPDPKLLSYRERENLGMARLGDDVERHLTWGRGSALTRLTEKDSAGGALTIAHRAAQAAINSVPLNELQQAATQVQQLAKEFGVNVRKLKPGLDVGGTTYGQTAISLHENNIPLRAAGLGTKRLVALAVQQTGIGTKSIVLIDEVEHGLEPHRIRQVLKKICDDHRKTQQRPLIDGQVMMTTHSPTPIMALDITEIRFVRCDEGTVTVLEPEPSSSELLQRIARTVPHAFLARRLIVCEGKTEEGLCRALDEAWCSTHQGLPMAHYGITAIHGGGAESPSVALGLRSLNYDVLYFGDSDKRLSPNERTLCDQGIEVVTWPGNTTTEDRITLDLPFASLQRLVDTAVHTFGKEEVLSAVKSRIGEKVNLVGLSVREWVTKGINETLIRKVIGIASRETLGGWFKDITAGINLGRIVAEVLHEVPTSPLATTLGRIEDWIYGS